MKSTAGLFSPNDVICNDQDLDLITSPRFAGRSKAPIVLVGIGSECASLATALRGHEREPRIRAICLLGPVAPWAERAAGGLPLGPLEPLRAVAERARRACSGCDSAGSIEVQRNGIATGARSKCSMCGGAQAVRLIVTAHPERINCEAWGGTGQKPRTWTDWHADPMPACKECRGGTRKPLGPAEIADELIGEAKATDYGVAEIFGGLEVLTYQSRSDHDGRAVVDALRRALG